MARLADTGYVLDSVLHGSHNDEVQGEHDQVVSAEVCARDSFMQIFKSWAFEASSHSAGRGRNSTTWILPYVYGGAPWLLTSSFIRVFLVLTDARFKISGVVLRAECVKPRMVVGMYLCARHARHFVLPSLRYDTVAVLCLFGRFIPVVPACLETQASTDRKTAQHPLTMPESILTGTPMAGHISHHRIRRSPASASRGVSL